MSSLFRKFLVLFFVIGFAMPVLAGVAQTKSPLGRELVSSLKAPDTSAASLKACTVSTGKKRSVELRVGPGTNRTSVAFLPSGTQFTVLGKSSDKDGKVWFQLDKKEVAPKSSAKEVWVLSTDVTTSGDCASVANAAAPPIVPITHVSAPAKTDSGTTTASSTGTIAPQAGTWTVSFARQTNASCAGTDNFVLNTSEVWIDWTEADYVQTIVIQAVTPDHFIFDGAQYQSTGNNHYMGSWTFEDGKNTQMYLTVLSPTSIVGQMIGNVGSGDEACSATLDMSATKS